jgi:hypothetical protein
MTYQEIIQAIEELPPHERDRVIELIGRQQEPQVGAKSTAPTRLPSDDVIHSIDLDGNPCDYPIHDLIWNPDSYIYIKKQRHLFDLALPELICEYAGKYIIFEDGKTIDSDDDRDVLLDRVCETNFYKQREAIYCELVPKKLELNA